MPHVTPLHADHPRRVGGYRLTGLIAGMPSGPAFHAIAPDGTEVCVSLLAGEWVRDGAARDRFTAEASAAARVAPFCAARILDAGCEDDMAYLVTEYVPGPSLLDLVADAGPLAAGDLEALAIGAATGLAAIHQAGLVHGELGPERVVVSPAGPRVIDFGITPPYGAATPAADLAAWAVTVLFAATGRPASRDGLALLSGALRSLVVACLDADPAERPTARTVVTELLGTFEPPEGVLAGGARRAARLTASAQGRPAAGAPGLTSWQHGPGSAHAAGQRGRPHGPQHGPGQRSPGPRGAAHDGGEHAVRRGGRAAPRMRAAAPRRAAALWWIAGTIVCLLAIAAGVHVLQNQGLHAASGQGLHPAAATRQPGAGRSASARPSSSPTPTASPSTAAASPASSVTVPAGLAGTWAGQASQQGLATGFAVRIRLPAGSAAGSIRYSGTSFSCRGTLALLSYHGGTLTLQQVITTGRQTCANGTVTLRGGDPAGSQLRFSFRGTSGPEATGTLTRS
jgi:hypothetical protein